MLSRVAERLYWFARYVERAENTARLLLVYHQFVLDFPAKARPGWGSIIDVLGCNEIFGQERVRDEREVVDFVFSDSNNASSIVQCVAAARENLRTTREIMPSEAWELVNALYLYVSRKSHSEPMRATRHKLFNEVIHRCQLLNGMLAGCMNHGDPYQFILLGRNIERADMTTRIVDVGSARLLGGSQIQQPYENMMWISVLKSLSAYQMYRQHVRRSIRGRDVLDFLLRTGQFPRALMCCVNVIERSIMRLPQGESVVDILDEVRLRLAEIDLDSLKGDSLHRLIDELQLDLGRIHNGIVDTWFRPNLAA